MFNVFNNLFEEKGKFDKVILELIEYLEANPKSIFPTRVNIGDGNYFFHKVFTGQELKFPKSLKPHCKYTIEIEGNLWVKIISNNHINGRFMVVNRENGCNDLSKSVFNKLRAIVEKRFEEVRLEEF